MLLDRAQGLVASRVTAGGPSTAQALKVGADRSVSVGWCQVQVAGSTWPEIEALRKLYRDGSVKLRVYAAMYGPGPNADTLLTKGASIGEFDGRLTIRGIKVLIDGALGSKGAALLEPYNDHTGSG